MLVLGIIDSKPSSAALLQDEKILSAVAEERLSRMKMATGTPRQSIELVLRDSGVTPGEIDCVAIAQNVSVFEPEPLPWSGWFESEAKLKTRRFDNLSASLAPVVGHMPLAWELHHQIKRFLSRERLPKLSELFRKEYGIKAPLKVYDHHHCHATTAYYTSNFDQALVVTLDGGGDGRSGSVYIAENGVMRRLSFVDSFNSLGNFYSYVTKLCGFKAESHEGKVTGLAAFGEPIFADILREFLRYQEPGRIRYGVPMYHRSALRLISERLPRDFDRADLAASVQLVLEEIGTAFIRYWLRRTGMRNVAVSGGVFANVKFNQRIHELEEVDNFFVHPAMDDSGLAVGSALAALADHYGSEAGRLVRSLPNLYLGPEYSDGEMISAVQSAGLEARPEKDIHHRIGQLLAEGHVVARFVGRMEYGPRALGHRSILYQTTDPSVNDWLNKSLNRTEFMPFAPATLEEYARECYIGMEGAEEPARYMTITFNCTPKMRAQSAGVVHVDGTARPQILDPKTAPDFYGITKAYHQITDIPSVINTSFNMHGEPIVCTPEDAVRSFQQGNLEYLAMGDWLICNAEAIRNREQLIASRRKKTGGS
jgi:carbamoyltransferase